LLRRQNIAALGHGAACKKREPALKFNSFSCGDLCAFYAGPAPRTTGFTSDYAKFRKD
jgi:hypothetical protein